MKYLWLLSASACSVHSGPIFFESGTYQVNKDRYDDEQLSSLFPDFTMEEDTATFDYTLSEENATILESLTLELRLESGTAQISGLANDILLTITERPQKEWVYLCPMQISATIVQTVDIEESLTLWGRSVSNAYIYADDCGGEERTIETIAIAEDENNILFLTKQ